jgi:uncharacterized phage protein gp47/JayE
MADYGLTTTGFVAKTYEVLVEEMNAALRATFGNSINLTNGIMAKFVAIVCERYAELWELMEAVYSSQDPDKAMDTALEALCALTGTIKNPATASEVTLTLTGTPATVVPAGSRAATLSTAKKFATNASATITLVSNWLNGVAYALGDRRVNDSGKVYQCTQAGTSDPITSGPTGTGTGIVDNTCLWDYLGSGTGAVDVEATCTETGVITAFARDISVIDTPVGGWSSVINIEDADLGSAVETNEELRTRRELELAQSGSSPVDALRAALLEVEDVTAVTVFVNNTDVTDADGIPPHAVEAMVMGGENQDIFDALLANVAAGIATYGAPAGLQTGTALDSQGTAHTMKFSRPEEIPIYVVMGVTKNAKTYPTTGDALIKEAIVTWGDAQDTGKDAVPSGIIAQAFGVTGVLAVTYIGISTSTIATPTIWNSSSVYAIGNVVVNAGRVYRCTSGGTSSAVVGSGPSATGTGIIDGTVTWAHLGETIPMALRQLATYDTSRITIISTSGTP